MVLPCVPLNFPSIFDLILPAGNYLTAALLSSLCKRWTHVVLPNWGRTWGCQLEAAGGEIEKHIECQEIREGVVIWVGNG